MSPVRAPHHPHPASKPALFLALRRSLVVILAAVALLGVASSGSVVFAQDTNQADAQELERQAEAIARTVMSPFCPGRTVSSCPNAGPWRDDIRKWVAEGVPAEEIRRRLYERVPDVNLTGIPPNRLGWFLPIGAALLAVGALVVVLRFMVKPAKPAESTTASSNGDAPSPAAKKNEDYDARLDEELETLEQP